MESYHIFSYEDPVKDMTKQNPHVVIGVFANALLALG
jgi:hypothetical protein